MNHLCTGLPRLIVVCSVLTLVIIYRSTLFIGVVHRLIHKFTNDWLQYPWNQLFDRIPDVWCNLGNQPLLNPYFLCRSIFKEWIMRHPLALGPNTTSNQWCRGPNIGYIIVIFLRDGDTRVAFPAKCLHMMLRGQCFEVNISGACGSSIESESPLQRVLLHIWFSRDMVVKRNSE